MIHITPSIALDENEIHEEFIRASGPGGQNVNKVATAVQLRFNARRSPSLPADVRDRLLRIAGRRVNAAGEVVLQASRFRTQDANRADAVERLVALIRQAAAKPKQRRATKPTRSAKEHRLEGKKKRGRIKALRRGIADD